MLNISTTAHHHRGGGGGHGSRSEGNSRSASVQGRRSGEIMGIEEEDEEEIEEVEEFSPITRPGEFAEEVVGESPSDFVSVEVLGKDIAGDGELKPPPPVEKDIAA